GFGLKQGSCESDCPLFRRACCCGFKLLYLHYRFLVIAGPFSQRSIGFPAVGATNGNEIFRPSPAEAYPALSACITTKPSSPVMIGVSLPRTQRAKWCNSCGVP